MAASLTEEETCYLRLVTLVIRVAPKAVRAYFDNIFPPLTLFAELNKPKNYSTLQDLRNKRVLTASQWNTLFPPGGSTVISSVDFDLTLLICLLRHIGCVTAPRQGFDNLPHATEISVGADLARIKYYRNKIVHSSDSSISKSEFEDAWDLLSRAADRLGGTTFLKMCSDMKYTSLDNESYKDILQNIKQSQNEQVEDLYNNIESLIAKINEMELTHKKQIDELEQTQIKKIDQLEQTQKEQLDKLEQTQKYQDRLQTKAFEHLLSRWEKDDSTFVVTKCSIEILELVKNEQVVIITGNAGMGKTFTAKHVALQMQSEGYTIVPVRSAERLLEYIFPDTKMLFVVDDMYGKYSVIYREVEEWDRYTSEIQKCLSEHPIKILSTCRIQISQSQQVKDLIASDCKFDMIGSKFSVSILEKRLIAKKYLPKTCVDALLDAEIKQHDFFPLLCQLGSKKDECEISKFLLNPNQVYEAELGRLAINEDRLMFSSLALVVVYNNHLEKHLLTMPIDNHTRELFDDVLEACGERRGSSRLRIQESIDSLQQSYLLEDNDVYSFIHQKLFDIVSYFIVQKMTLCIVKHGSLTLLIERFYLKSEKDVNSEFSIALPENLEGQYIERLINDLNCETMIDIFSCSQMQNFKFQKTFHVHLRKMDDDKISELLQLSSAGIPIFHLMCKLDCTELIQFCLIRGADVNECDIIGVTPLHFACRGTAKNAVNILLNEWANVNIYQKCGYTPLYEACKVGDTVIAEVLLKHGALPNLCTKKLLLPLLIAIEKGNLAIVKLLIRHNADIFNHDKEEASALYVACKYGHNEIVTYLLSLDVNVNRVKLKNKYSDEDREEIVFSSGESFQEIISSVDKGLEKMLSLDNERLQHKLSFDDESLEYNPSSDDKSLEYKPSSDDESLEYKPSSDDESLEYKPSSDDESLEYKPSSDDKSLEYKPSSDDESLEYKASSDDQSLEYKPVSDDKSLNYKPSSDDKSLEYKLSSDEESLEQMASLDGTSITTTKLVSEYGVLPNFDAQSLLHPLLIATEKGNLETVKLLIQHNAEINKQDREGRSAIYVACSNRHNEIVIYLLNQGAEVNIATNMSERQCHGKYVTSCSKEAKHGLTDLNPLHVAVMQNNTSLVSILLQFGARTDIPCRSIPLFNLKNIQYDFPNCADKMFPIHIACLIGNVDILKLILNSWSCFQLRPCIWVYPYEVSRMEGNFVAEWEFEMAGKLQLNPLQIACLRCHWNLCCLLVDSKADVLETFVVSEWIVSCFTGTTDELYYCEKSIYIPYETSVLQFAVTNGGYILVCKIVNSLYKDNLKAAVKEMFRLSSYEDFLSILYELDMCSSKSLDNMNSSFSAFIDLLLNADIFVKNNDTENLLHIAVEERYKNAFHVLLGRSSHVFDPNKNGDNVLHLACKYNKSEYVSELIVRIQQDVLSKKDRVLNESMTMTVDVYNRINEDGKTPLCIACEDGYSEIITQLLNNGADVNVTTCEGYSPLFYACENRDAHIVKHLLEKNADANILLEGTESLLIYMCRAKPIDYYIVDLLLQHGASVNYCYIEGETALYFAFNLKDEKLMALLLHYNADWNLCSHEKSFYLYEACRQRMVGTVELIVKHDDSLDVNAACPNLDTPLFACYKSMCVVMTEDYECYVKISTILLNEGADINWTSTIGSSPFHQLCVNGKESDIKTVLEKGIVNKYILNKQVEWAVTNDMEDIVRLILEHCSELFTLESLYRCWFKYSAQGPLNILKHLYDLKVNINKTDVYGRTALHLSCAKRHTHIVEFLLGCEGIKVDITNIEGYAPLHVACLKDDSGIVEMLLNSGSGIDKLTSKGENVYILGFQNRCYSVIHMLFRRHKNLSLCEFDKQLRQCWNMYYFFPSLKTEAQMLMLSYFPSAKFDDMDSLVHFACRNNDEELLEFFINNNIDIHRENKHGETPLLISIAQKNEFLVSMLLRGDVSARRVCNLNDHVVKKYSFSCPIGMKRKITTLGMACEVGNSKIVKLLIEHKASPVTNSTTYHSFQNEEVYEEMSPLFISVINNNARIVKLLLETKFNAQFCLRSYVLESTLIDHLAKIGNKSYCSSGMNLLELTPFQAACLLGLKHIIRLMIEYNIFDLNESFMITPLLLSIHMNTFIGMQNLLMKYDYYDNYFTAEVSPLIFAALIRDTDLIDILSNYALHDTTETTLSLLHVISLNKEILDAYLSCSETFNLTSTCTVSDVALLCLHGDREMLLKLFHNKNILNDRVELTALHVICFRGFITYEFDESILEFVIELSVVAKLASLHIACFKNNFRMFQQLLKLKTDVNAVATLSSMHIPFIQNHDRLYYKCLFDTIKEQNLTPKLINESSCNVCAVHILCIKGNIDFLTHLIRFKSDFNVFAKLTTLCLYILTEDFGVDIPLRLDIINAFSEMTPLHIACLFEKAAVLDCLLESECKTDWYGHLFPLHINRSYCADIPDLIMEDSIFTLTALHLSILNENIDISDLLIRKGADVNSIGFLVLSLKLSENRYIVSKSTVSVLQMICMLGNDLILISLISKCTFIDSLYTISLWLLYFFECIQYDSHIHPYLHDDVTLIVNALHIACLSGSVDSLRVLLDAGANVERMAEICPGRSTKYWNFSVLKYPLHLTAEIGIIDMCKELLDHGACVDVITNKAGLQPWHLALYHGHINVVELLLSTNRIACFNKTKFLFVLSLHFMKKIFSGKIVGFIAKSRQFFIIWSVYRYLMNLFELP